MKLEGFRQGIVTKIKMELPELPTVEVHPGGFNLDELAGISTQLPMVRIACMGSAAVKKIDTGEKEAHLKMAAFVVTEDRQGLSKDTAAINIVEALLTLIPDQQWDISGTSNAENIKADNLYSGQANHQGVALWAIYWEQTTRIGVDTWRGGSLPTDVYVAYDSDHFGQAPKYKRLLINQTGG